MYRSVIYYSFFIEIVVFAFPKAIFDRLAQAGQMDGYMQHYYLLWRFADFWPDFCNITLENLSFCKKSVIALW